MTLLSIVQSVLRLSRPRAASNNEASCPCCSGECCCPNGCAQDCCCKGECCAGGKCGCR